ncbi:MAG: hypothetical protein AAGG51_22780, partial [Cyanobacteria bacterium P01_G01_bin.54]
AVLGFTPLMLLAKYNLTRKTLILPCLTRSTEAGKMPALRDFLKERTVAQVVAERSRSASRLPPRLRNMDFTNSIHSVQPNLLPYPFLGVSQH